MKTQLHYRTFDELMEEVNTDFNVYSNEGMIEPGSLIKVAQRVTYDLGLRIHKTKERVLEIENGKAKLPDDFYVMNYAMLCGKYTVTRKVPMGTQTYEVVVGDTTDDTVCHTCNLPAQSCLCESVKLTECGDEIKLVVKQKYETREYTAFNRVRFKPAKYLAQNCVNINEQSIYNAEIKNGFIYASINNGQMYISYEGSLEDEDGNLLVLDHPMINEYYEYAIKKRILENLAMNGEDVVNRMNIIAPEYRAARNNALGIVNTPDFAELKQIHDTNRKAQYAKYYSAFSSTPMH